jgi:hypothetical protein
MASLTFPSSPSDGDTYTYDGLIYVYNSTKNKWSVKTTATITGVSVDSIDAHFIPSANVSYDLGTSGKSFRDLYLSGSSIQLGAQQITSNTTGVILPEGSFVGTTAIGTGSGSSVTVYANASILPTSGLTSGDMAYTGNAIFITNGSGWYRVAVTNQDPQLSITQDSLSFTGNTGAVLDFNYTVSDPDGTTPTITLSNSGFANTSVATIEHFTANNTVRITNFANTTYTGSITLTASDGISTGFDSANAIFTATVEITGPVYPWGNTVVSIGTSSTNSLDNSTYADRSGNISTTEYSSFGTGDIQNSEHPYATTWSSYITTETDALCWQDDDLVIGSGDFTAEGWFWVDASTIASGTYHALFDTSKSLSYNYDVTSHTTHIGFWLANSYILRIYSNGSAAGNTTNNLLVGRWNHIALVRSSGTIKCYINGVSGLSFSSTSNYNLNSVAFGVAPRWGASYTAGPMYVGDFRLEVGYARYTSNFDVPTAKFETTTDTKFLKTGRYDHKALVNGTVTAPIYKENVNVVPYNPFGQSEFDVENNKGSVQFDTSSGVALYVAGSSLSNVWTIECWYKFDTSSTIDANHYLFDSRSGGAMYLYRSSTTTYSSPGQSWALTDDNFNDGAWHHLAWACDGTNTTMWLDGSRVQTVVATTTIGTFLWINSRQTNQYHNDCKYSDLRVSSTARYASTATSITVPTAAVGYDNNTSAYYPFDNAGIYDKTGNHTITLIGDAATSTTQTKHADTSIALDGTGDYLSLSIADSTSPVIMTNGSAGQVWTLEAWVYASAYSGYNTIFTTRNSDSAQNNVSFWFGLNNNTLYPFLATATAQGQFSSALTQNTWHHVALTRESDGRIKFWLDGSSAGQSTATTYAFSGATNSIGGYPVSGFEWNGYIEGFQFTEGVVKYTGTFTPPTAEQGEQSQVTS